MFVQTVTSIYKILTVIIPKISIRQTTIHTTKGVTTPTKVQSVDAQISANIHKYSSTKVLAQSIGLSHHFAYPPFSITMPNCMSMIR